MPRKKQNAVCHPDRPAFGYRLCATCYHQVWYQNNRDQATRTIRRNWLRSKYGLTEEDYQKLYDAQKGRCKVCSKVVSRLHVDHDHETNVVRGLLCGDCNRGLGLFQDDPALLSRAAEYLVANGKVYRS